MLDRYFLKNTWYKVSYLRRLQDLSFPQTPTRVQGDTTLWMQPTTYGNRILSAVVTRHEPAD
jgi:hypothetical protein